MVKFKADLKSAKTKYNKENDQFLNITLEADFESIDHLEELLRMTGFVCSFSVTQSEKQMDIDDTIGENFKIVQNGKREVLHV